jgi:RNA polymerase sigma factor FliA
LGGDAFSGDVAGAARGEEELRMLWRRYKERGDPEARDRLILTFAPLVKYVAGRMRSALPSHVDEADLISYGLVGLIGAVERFDPARRVKFETYAITRIKGSIIDELRALDWVPRSVRARARAIEKKSAELEARLHRAPTDEELADALGMRSDEFQEAITQISNASLVALDEMWSVSPGGEPVSLLDTLGEARAGDPADVLDAVDLRDTLADAIARLPERERIVVALYYYDNLSLKEIGEILGVTESRVSQLHTKAVLRLKGRLQDGAAEADST